MRFLLAIVALSTMTSCSSYNRVVNGFIDDNKNEKGSIAMTIPGWLIRTGTNFAANFADDSDEKEYLKLSEHIEQVRFLVLSEGHDVSSEDVSSLVIRAQTEDEYEEYVRVRDEGTNVNVLMINKQDVVKSLLLVMRNDEEMAVVSMNTDLPLEKLKQAHLSFNKHKDKKVDYEI